MSADLICLSHLRWGFVFQRPNHLMSRCARSRRVYFVEEPTWDASSPRLDVSRIEDGLHVVVPHLPGGTEHAEAEAMQQALLEGLVEKESVESPLLWFYTPMALGYAPRVEASAVVYDCMDELSHFHGAPPALVERERALFGVADLVFTGGQSLYEAKRAHHPRVHAFPSSVDHRHFHVARAGMEDPADQRAIPRPRIGFYGVIDERLDVDLLRSVAETRPDLHLVMIGPVVKIDPACLPRLPNIHWLGQKRYEELPAYLAGWDAAMMPFARNDATKYISPTKTLEYLAAGKPVVSTSIRDVVKPYGEDGHVHIADDPHAFAAAIDEALAQTRDEERHALRCAARDAMLEGTSWDSTWERMNALIEEVITDDAELAKTGS